MKETIKSRYEARTRIIKAMSHPTRLFMVDELSRGERCVCELQEMIGHDMSTTSRHLSILRRAGIVTGDKRKNQIYYSLRLPCVLNFFACVDTVIENNATELQSLL